ncbi:MAG TPA: ROK family protein [Dictyobacter sp.]|jgi:predicted NBD/HSP70 family sugar kinase|nr:ROK family protein [Dictyobacter sp.]
MYIGVDIGGTSTRVGLFSSTTSVDFALLAHFPTQPEYEQQLQKINAVLEAAALTTISGIGVSIGGRLTRDGRAVAVAPNLPSYVDKPFAQVLQERWHCDVRLGHDTVCGVLGEKCFGILQSYERCAYLTLSTGTGAAVHLSKGTNTLIISIEVAHQLLDGNILICLCGQTGCLETYTGGRQLELRLGQKVEHISDPAFWELFSDKLSLGLVNLVQLTRVEAIAVSGAIALHNIAILASLQHKVDGHLRGASVRLLPALLGENAPLVGAVALLTAPEDEILH